MSLGSVGRSGTTKRPDSSWTSVLCGSACSPSTKKTRRSLWLRSSTSKRPAVTSKSKLLLLLGLDVGKSPRERRNELLVRHAVRRLEALGEVVAEVIVLDGQPLGMAEYDVADATRDRKGDLDVVVERHVVERVAERTLEAWVDLIELAKTAGDLWAVSADEQPVHLEQARPWRRARTARFRPLHRGR